MPNYQKSLGRNRDIPLVASATLASASGGTGSDPTVESALFSVPALINSFLPSLYGEGARSNIPMNHVAIRQATLTANYGSNVAGNATNWGDFRINAFRSGALQGVLAWYSLSVNTTAGTLIQANYTTTSSTVITASSTTSITVGANTGIVVGSPMLITGTGVDSGKTDYVAVSSVSGTTIGIATTANSYSATVTLTNPNVYTQSTTTVTSGSTVITPTSMNGIVANQVLYVFGGTGNAEYVKVASVTSTTFTATFAQAHSGTYTVTSYPSANPGVQFGTTGYGMNAQLTAVIPASLTSIVPGMQLGLGSGSTFEVATVVSSLPGTNGFLVACSYSHAYSEALTSILVPYTPISMTNAYSLPAVGTTSTLSAPTSGSYTFSPASIYGIHVGDQLTVSGGSTFEQLATTTVSSTTLTGAFSQAHAGTYNVGYVVNATSATAITATTTTTIVCSNVTNIVAGNTVILKGTGADSAKTDTLTVQSVTPATKTVVFTAAPGTNSYSNTVNITSVAYSTTATSVTGGTGPQTALLSSTAGLAANGLAYIQPLASNTSTSGFSGTGELVYLTAVSAGVSITFSPVSSYTGTYAVIPLTATTSATVVSTAGSQNITLTSGTNFATGVTPYVWGGTATAPTETITITSLTHTTGTATFASPHTGTVTLQPYTLYSNNISATVAEPFELRGGDTVTVTRVSNNGTGIATPAVLASIELVPSRILQ